VLGCTHYPFVIPVIQRIVGPHVRVIDPSPAVARQVQRLLVADSLLSIGPPVPETPVVEPRHLLHFFTTGNPGHMEDMLVDLLGFKYQVEALKWQAGNLAQRK